LRTAECACSACSGACGARRWRAARDTRLWRLGLRTVFHGALQATGIGRPQRQARKRRARGAICALRGPASRADPRWREFRIAGELSTTFALVTALLAPS
jgi:hypothetical protein